MGLEHRQHRGNPGLERRVARADGERGGGEADLAERVRPVVELRTVEERRRRQERLNDPRGEPGTVSWYDQSARSARAGSTRAARHAGTSAASTPAASSTAATSANAEGSFGRTP